MIQIYNDDCLRILRDFSDNSIDLLVTSPPYFNAREYSHWDTIDDYMHDMTKIFNQAFRCLRNHKYIVVNVADITCQALKAKWSTRKFPLGAYFIKMLEDIGFDFQDDFIWDKGEVQSNRMKGNPPYPFYQYPANCYEHILIFSKHLLDKTRLRCPICNSDKVASNSLTGFGIQSFECKNPDCPAISKGGRGKRFSARSIMMNDYKTEENLIEDELIKKWRKDIVRINPVIKINCKGENIANHSAPYPQDIPYMAIKFFSGVGDVVIDPFLGSGTTGVVAKNLNRNFIGIELNKEYFELSRERILNS